MLPAGLIACRHATLRGYAGLGAAAPAPADARPRQNCETTCVTLSAGVSVPPKICSTCNTHPDNVIVLAQLCITCMGRAQVHIKISDACLVLMRRGYGQQCKCCGGVHPVTYPHDEAHLEQLVHPL
jgi:hypothetical protein